MLPTIVLFLVLENYIYISLFPTASNVSVMLFAGSLSRRLTM